MGAGRPTKYDPSFCERLIDYMADGMSYEAFAGHLGVAISTLYEWEKHNPEFSEAKKVGFQKNLDWWEKLGRGMAAGKIKHGNAAVWIFNMKNRHKWTDRIEQQNTNANINVNIDADESDL